MKSAGTALDDIKIHVKLKIARLCAAPDAHMHGSRCGQGDFLSS